MANKKFDIKINLDTKEVDLGTASTLNLNKQLRVLKDFASRNEGKLTAEQFAILSAAINDTEDNVKSLNARSGEFFNTLSMLPGPIGDIGQSLDSTIGLLKTFSSFNISNVGSQLKGLGADIGGIVKSFLGLGTAQKTAAIQSETLAVAEAEVAVATDAATVSTEAQTVATKGLTVAEAGATTAAGILKVALKAVGIGLLVGAVLLLIEYWDKIVSKIKNAVPIFGAVADAIGSVVTWFTDLIGVTSEAEREEAKRQATFAKAKGNADLVNQGIQREINLMKAKGATQDEIDKKERQIIVNKLKPLLELSGKQKMLYGQQATDYKDYVNQLQVLDAEGNRRRQEEADKAAKDRTDKNKQANQKYLQDEKAFRDQLAQYEKEGRDALGQTRQGELDDEKAKYEKLKAGIQKFGGDMEALTKAYKQKVDAVNKNYDKKEQADAEKFYEDNLKQLQTYLDKRTAKIDKARDLAGKTEIQGLRKQLYDGKITQDQFDQQALESNLKFTKQKQTDDENANNFANASLVVQRMAGLIGLKEYNDAKTDLDTKYETTKGENQVAVTDATLAVDQKSFEDGKKLAEARVQVAQAEADSKVAINTAYADVIGTIGSLFQQFAGNNKKLAKAGVVLEQGANIAKILIGAASSISTQTSAAAAQSVAFPLLAPKIAANLARGIITTKIGAGIGIAGAIAGAVQGISQIDSAQTDQSSQLSAKQAAEAGGKPSGGGAINVVATRAAGGYISGGGTSKSDSVPAFLSNGEFVVNARSSSMFSGLLNQINDAGNSPQFAMGGLQSLQGTTPNLSGNENASLTEIMSRPVKAYVTTQDMSNGQQMERTIKQRSII